MDNAAALEWFQALVSAPVVSGSDGVSLLDLSLTTELPFLGWQSVLTRVCTGLITAVVMGHVRAGRNVVVTGTPGVGKSRFAAELIRAAVSEFLVVVFEARGSGIVFKIVCGGGGGGGGIQRITTMSYKNFNPVLDLDLREE